MESTSINLKNLSVLPMMDRWILSCLYNFLINYEANLRSCKFHLVTEAIRTFFYSQYCDVYLVRIFYLHFLTVMGVLNWSRELFFRNSRSWS